MNASSRAGFFRFSPGRTFLKCCLLASCCLVSGLAVQAEGRDGIIQFFDGSSLHGKLLAVNPGQTLVWNHPAVEDPIRFQLANVAWVRFSRSQPAGKENSSGHLITFRNGDKIYGELISLDPERVVIATDSGNQLQTSREELKSMVALPKNYTLLREGPSSMESWEATLKTTAAATSATTTRSRSAGWEFRNGSFVVEGQGILGTSLETRESLSVEFDLDWTGFFGLNVCFFSENAQTDAYRSHACNIRLLPATVSVQTLAENGRPTQLGSETVPAMTNLNPIHFEARVNPIQQTVKVYLNGELLRSWKDRRAWMLKGNALVLSSVRSDSLLKISNLQIATWDGEYLEPPPSNSEADAKLRESDRLYLVNHDRVEGAIEELRQEKLQVETSLIDLSIPVERIAHIQFKQPEEFAANAVPAEGVRAHLRGGGRVSFVPQKWSDREVLGGSERYGKLLFNPASFRELRFNLQRTEPVAEQVNLEKDIVWEITE